MKKQIDLEYMKQFRNWRNNVGPTHKYQRIKIRKFGSLLPQSYQGRRTFRFKLAGYKKLAIAVVLLLLGVVWAVFSLLPTYLVNYRGLPENPDYKYLLLLAPFGVL